ncbi:MAG: heparinase II/III domain-containing protein, partial [Candidatus Anammoxibacter sp.]
LYYHSIKYMRYKQILWRIFFWIKKTVYRKCNLYPDLICSGKFKDVELDKNFRFFIGNEIIKRETNVFDDSQYYDIDDLKTRVAPIIKNKEFCFLNKSVTFQNGIEWQSNELERLWLYNLHYFDYAFDLGVVNLVENDSDCFKSFRSLVVDWIDKNRRIGYGCGWEPYPVSLRIVNWIYAYNLFVDEMGKDAEFNIMFLKSIAIQTEFLSNNIERHVCGNHLVRNGKALFLAGFFFRGEHAAKWKAKGENILINEAEVQILDDGGHFEGSPMYHLIVLQDYLEMFILSKRNNITFTVEEKLKKMLVFLVNIIHPDNQIPLFNDSAFGIAKEPEEICFVGTWFLDGLSDYDDLCKTTLYTFLLTGKLGLRIADCGLRDSEGGRQKAVDRWQRTENRKQEVETESLSDCQNKNLVTSNPQLATLFEDSGFCVIRSKENDRFMVISCKAPSPDYLPGHSHADMLSYELSLGCNRFIIDSGVNNYSEGKWRDYFRSTRAHNTITVNGTDQSELWGTFGVARRAELQAMRLQAMRLQTMRLQTMRLDSVNDNAVFFESRLKGFPELDAICHQRSIYFIDNLFWLIFDTIKSGCADLQSYKVESFIHVHPDRLVEFVKSDDNAHNIIIKGEKERLYVCPVQFSANLNNDGLTQLEIISEDEKVIQGWYAPEFGRRVKNNVITIGREGTLPMHVGYVLFPSNKDSCTVSALCKTVSTGGSSIENNILDMEIVTPEGSYSIKKCDADVRVNKM